MDCSWMLGSCTTARCCCTAADTFQKKPLHSMCLSNNRAFTHSTSELPCFDTHAPTHKGTSTPRQQHNPCITPCTSLHVANQSSSMQRQQSIIGTQTSFASSSAISSTPC